REKREYGSSDQIMVLSKFARDSFLDHGIESRKLALVPLGSELSRFRATDSALQARKERILSGKPIQILTVGTWSLQKGCQYLHRTVQQLSEHFRFCFIGAIAADAKFLMKDSKRFIKFLPRVPQFELAKEYARGDVFFFPTLQDGYAAVLAQAHAAGLPIL